MELKKGRGRSPSRGKKTGGGPELKGMVAEDAEVRGEIDFASKNVSCWVEVLQKGNCGAGRGKIGLFNIQGKPVGALSGGGVQQKKVLNQKTSRRGPREEGAETMPVFLQCSGKQDRGY